jgi:hypothetical protein
MCCQLIDSLLLLVCYRVRVIPFHTFLAPQCNLNCVEAGSMDLTGFVDLNKLSLAARQRAAQC